MPKKREWPLKIEPVEWAGDETPYSKGHHDVAAFVAAALDEDYEVDPRYVEHEWWRAMPDSTGQYDIRYVRVDGPGRGAFPATVERH